MLFKLINNILYLTTVHKNCVDPQINIFNLSFNELLYKKLTPSIYSVHPYTHKLTLLGCTVHLKCSVLYQYCVHILNTYTTCTYTLTISLICLQTIFNYISSWLTLVI